MTSEKQCWLSDDVARCAGVGSDAEGWREGCDTCLRRLAPGGRVHIQPPPIIAFWCEFQIDAEAYNAKVDRRGIPRPVERVVGQSGGAK